MPVIITFMKVDKKRIGEILEELEAITQRQLKEALQRQSQDSGRRLGEILLEMGVVTERQLVKALAIQFDYSMVKSENIKPSPELVSLISKSLCEEHCTVPLTMSGNSITMVVSDPVDLKSVENLKFLLSKNIEVVLATKEDIKQAIKRVYGGQKSEMTELIEKAATPSDIKLRGEDLEIKEDGQSQDDAPVIKFVQLMIQEAVKSRASDIHIEPMENRVKLRYRIDGILQEVNEVPKRLHSSLTSRIKIMAGMDISEKRKPQDGRISVSVAGKSLDIRVSSIPSVYGESIVMRLLDKEAGLVGLEELGFHSTDYDRFKNIITKPNGIILVTGPTGSGKTTTLYAILKALNNTDKKIITAENPIEYNLVGINQCQVKEQIGLTFARILRAMLRQAPNIILVGEIRDQETAQVATQAALTGHLVFSTLHTNDAPGALTRLLDMGVKPFLVASSIQAIMAQRLIRILCECKKEIPPPDLDVLKALNLSREKIEGKKIYGPAGCKNCRQTGYKGRKGIFELMELDTTLREMVFKRESHNNLREYSRMRGMVTLMEDGLRKVFDGITSFEEILSLTHREDITY